MEIFILITLLVLLVYYIMKVNKFKLPPGPRKVPILGNLPFLSMEKGVNDWVLDHHVTRHGLATVQIGPSRRFFIINDFELAKDLFDRDEFSGRTPSKLQLTSRYFNMVPQGILFSEGSQWSTQRRFSLKTLKDFGFGKKSIESSIHFEVEEIIESFLDHTGEDFLVGLDFNVPIINVLWQMAANSRFTPADPEGMKMVETVTNIFLVGFKVDRLPYWLNNLFPSLNGFGQRKVSHELIRDYLMSVAKDHQRNHDPSNPRDFIDVYLTEILKDESGEKYNLEELVSCIYDFFVAGTETSSTTLKWILLYFTLYPEVQQKCREEIRQKVGSGAVSVADLTSLPYLQATITEVQRVSRVGPLSIPHTTRGPTQVEGYTFPARSQFLANLSFIMNDPRYFDEPEQFKPSRFISDDGRFVKDDRFVPFGIGKRLCMGEMLARNEVFIFTASLVQQLKFLPPLQHSAPDPNNYLVNLTRIPDDFFVRVIRAS